MILRCMIVDHDVIVGGGYAVGVIILRGGFAEDGMTVGSEVVVGGDAIVGGGMIVAVDSGVAQELASLDLTPGNPAPSPQELANVIGGD